MARLLSVNVGLPREITWNNRTIRTGIWKTPVRGRCRDLLERGVQVGDISHETPIAAWDGGFAAGLDPARGDYASFAGFSDPDGNSWMLQERGYRAG